MRRECEAQTRQGVYTCPEGTPARCRYWLNPLLNEYPECVYYYCTQVSDDPCCAFITGGETSSANFPLYNEGSVQTRILNSSYSYDDPTRTEGITYAAFATTAEAPSICANVGVVSTLTALGSTGSGHWAPEWHQDVR